jgi:hypothetical protein
LGACAAGCLCPYKSKIAKHTFAIAIRSGDAGATQSDAEQDHLIVFCCPECCVKSCVGESAAAAASSLLDWKYSTGFTWQRQQWEQRQQREQLTAISSSSAAATTVNKIAVSASVSAGTDATISKVGLSFCLKRKDPPKTDARPPPAKRLSDDAQNNAAAAAYPAASLPPPSAVAVAAGAAVPGGFSPIPVTRSVKERFEYMEQLLRMKKGKCWPVADKERDERGFVPPAIKKQLLWWVRDDGLGEGSGILLEAPYFDTLMGLAREGWGLDDKRVPPGT